MRRVPIYKAVVATVVPPQELKLDEVKASVAKYMAQQATVVKSGTDSYNESKKIVLGLAVRVRRNVPQPDCADCEVAPLLQIRC